MSHITIGQSEVTAVTYLDQRVVTFAQIDKVHDRAEGTAKRNFSDNRARFIDGLDFAVVPASQKNEFRTFGIHIPNRGLTVLTRRGYLKLVKSFNDDLAWSIFDDMIDRYFAVATNLSNTQVLSPELNLIEFADRARTDIEAVRDLITREGHGTRGALIKTVKELAGNPIGALKAYLDDRFMASRERDKMVICSLAALDRSVGQVLSLARRSLEPDAFVASDWVAVSGVYAIAGITGPVARQKSLSARLTVSLMAFCIETHRQMDMRGINFDRKVHLYRATAVRAWLKDRGRVLIDQHIAKHSAQTVIQFPGNIGEVK